MTPNASSHTSWNEGVPDFGHKDPEDLFRHIYQSVPFRDDDHVSPKHYLELCLAVAKLLEENTSGDEVRSSRIYDEVSDECEAAIKALDGSLTRGGVAVGRIGDRGKLLMMDHNSESYVDSDGKKRWGPKVGTGTTRWAVGFLVDHLYEYVDQWGTTPTIVAEAADHYINDEDDALLDSLADPKILRSQVLPTDPAEAAQERDGGADEADRGDGEGGPGLPPTVKAGDGCGSNGLPVTGVGPPDNRRSERSDRNSEVDTDHVYKGFCFRRRGTREQRQWLDRKVRSMPERMLFLHLLKKGQQVWYTSSESEGRWITVPAKDMVDLMGASYPTEGVWRLSELIEPYRDGRYVAKEEAREFRVPTDVKVEWTKRGQETRSKRYLLYTSQPERAGERRPLTDDLQDENDNAYPDVVKESIETLGTQKIDMNAVDEAELRLAEMDTAKAEHQLAQLQEAKDTIERQIIDIDEDGIATIQNAHEMQPLSGRVSFKDGGPMALPGPVKAKAYDLPGVKNWDIRSCHTVGLRQQADDLEEVGVDVDTAPLDEYLAEDEEGRSGKYKIAARTGLPSGLVKSTEHGVKYLMKLPASIDHASAITGGDPEDLDIVEECKKYEEWGEIDDVDQALTTLREVFTPLRDMAEEMAEALLEEYWEAHKKPGGPAGWAMENASGVLFRPDNWDEGHDRKSHVISWYLQGLESSYVHEIIRLSKGEDYEAWTNEHDGLQTKGDIRERVMDDAAERSGFERAELVEKDHADEEEIEALYSEFGYDGTEARADDEETESNGEQGEDETSTIQSDDNHERSASGDTVPGAPRPPTPTGMGATQPPAHTDAPDGAPEPDDDDTAVAEPPGEAYHPCPEQATREQIERWAALQRGEEDLYGAPATRAYQQKYGHDGMGEIPDPDQL